MSRNRGNLLGMMTALYEKGEGNAKRSEVAKRYRVSNNAPSALAALGLCEWKGSAFQWIGAKPTRATEKRVYDYLAKQQRNRLDSIAKEADTKQPFIPFKMATPKPNKGKKSRKTSKGNRVSVSIAWGLVKFEIPTTR